MGDREFTEHAEVLAFYGTGSIADIERNSSDIVHPQVPISR
jgi:hypothetical protein